VGDLKDRIAESIAKLPEREKLVIALYYYENLTLREIGEVLGVTESRVSRCTPRPFCACARACRRSPSRLIEYPCGQWPPERSSRPSRMWPVMCVSDGCCEASRRTSFSAQASATPCGELCAPRATHEGWLRETDRQSVSLAPLRPRRGRNLFDRLRQVGKPAGREAEAASGDSSPQLEPERLPYDFLDGETVVADPQAEQPPTFAALAAPQLETAPVVGRRARRKRDRGVQRGRASPSRGGRRSLAGCARGERSSDKDIHSLVSIVVAWELCWYRYQVDIEDEGAEAMVLAQAPSSRTPAARIGARTPSPASAARCRCRAPESGTPACLFAGGE